MPTTIAPDAQKRRTERLLLATSIVCGAIAMGLFIPLVRDEGLSWDLLSVFDHNSMALVIAVDLLIVGAMFLAWSWFDARRHGVRGWFAVALVTVFIAISCGLPLYLYLRSRAGAPALFARS